MNQIHRFVGKGYDVYRFSRRRLGSIRPNQGNEGGISMNRKILAASLAVVTLSGGAFSVEAAETPVYTLDGIVVTASRVPEKKIDSNADVSVVTAKEIETDHYDDVSEAVRHIPGVVVSNSSGNGQNYKSNKLYINGSNKVVLLIDGVRMNTNGLTTGSAVTLAQHVNMESIERIEVLKGAASTLYGSDAQGGVINIITKKPQEGKIKTSLTFSAGSYNGAKYSLYNEGNKDGYFWSVEAQKELQGDYKDAHDHKVINDLDAKSYQFKFGKDLGNDSSVALYYSKYKSDYQRPDQPYMHSGTGNKTVDYGKMDNDSISLQYKAKINKHLTNHFTIYRSRTEFKDNYKSLDSSWFMRMKSSGITDQLTWKNEKHTVTGGVDYYKDELPEFYSYGSRDDAEGKHISDTAFYIQDVWNINNHWNLTPGIRYDHNSRFGGHTTPALTIGYKQDEKTNYYLGYKEFFVAPDLYQLYDAYFGDKDLNPQEGGTWQFGINKIFDDTLSGTFNVYHTHAKNMIIYDYDTYKYTNSGSVDTNGAGLQLTKQIGKHWTTTFGYTYTHVEGDESTKSNLNGFLPKHTVDIGVSYLDNKFDANITGRAVFGREAGKNYKGEVPSRYKNYNVWDAAFNYKPVSYAKIFFKINNIFNEYYCDVGTFTSSAYGETHDWYSMPGRNYQIGVTFQF